MKNKADAREQSRREHLERRRRREEREERDEREAIRREINEDPEIIRLRAEEGRKAAQVLARQSLVDNKREELEAAKQQDQKGRSILAGSVRSRHYFESPNPSQIPQS